MHYLDKYTLLILSVIILLSIAPSAYANKQSCNKASAVENTLVMKVLLIATTDDVDNYKASNTVMHNIYSKLTLLLYYPGAIISSTAFDYDLSNYFINGILSWLSLASLILLIYCIVCHKKFSKTAVVRLMLISLTIYTLMITACIYNAEKHVINRLIPMTELLSANGIPYDIISNATKEIYSSDKYTTIINLIDAKEQSNVLINYLNTAASLNGTSLIGFNNSVDRRMNDIYGIEVCNKVQRDAKLKLGNVTDLLGNEWCDYESYIDNKFTTFHDIKVRLDSVVVENEEYGTLKSILNRIFLLKTLQAIKSFLKTRQNELLQTRKPVVNAINISKTTRMLASYNNKPCVTVNKYNNATNYYFAFDIIDLMRRPTILDRMIIAAIKKNSGHGFVSYALTDTILLRMDDPGASQNIFYKKSYYPELNMEWKAINTILRKHNAVMTVFYCPGWVDDGDMSRGRLYLNRIEIKNRTPGKTYLSKNVIYVDTNGQKPGTIHDYANSYIEIRRGVDAGVIDIQSHGNTHLNQNQEKWSKSKDKYDNWKWYREFYDSINNKEIADNSQKKALVASGLAINEWYHKKPMCFVPPGHAISHGTFASAFECGYDMVVMDNYIVYGTNGRYKVNTQIMSVPPETDYVKYAVTGTPTIVYFHAKDISINGTKWLNDTILKWKSMTDKRIITFEELYNNLSRELYVTKRNNELLIKLSTSNKTTNADNHYDTMPVYLNMILPEHQLGVLQQMRNTDGAKIYKTAKNNEYVVKVQQAIAHKPVYVSMTIKKSSK